MNNQRHAPVDGDDGFLESISHGYPGIVLTIAPAVFTCEAVVYRFVYMTLSQKFPSVHVFILIVTLAAFTLATYVICYFLYEKFSDPPPTDVCMDCVKTNVLDLILLRYDLITLAHLEKIEQEVQRGDEILIYTCSLGTEPYDVVRQNVKRKKIQYDILYYEGKFPVENEWLYRSAIKLTPQESGFDSKMAHSSSNNTGCGFDMFIIKRKPTVRGEKHKIEAYYAVNYSTNYQTCTRKARGRCHKDLQCDLDNEKLFYRRVDEELAEVIYRQLKRQTKKKTFFKRVSQRIRGITMRGKR